MFIKRRVDGTIRLSRYREFLWFVLIATLLGAISAAGEFGISFIAVLVANWLAVGFMFMINDVEDAPDDMLTPQKANRNPVSAGLLSLRSGWWASALVALLSAFLYWMVGAWAMFWGCFGILLGYVYSWKKIRLKTYPLVDFLSHGMMLAGCQYLAAYSAYPPGKNWWWFIPFIMLVSISMYGEIFNEVRDFHKDKEAGLQHTAVIIGHIPAQVLMYLFLGMGIVCLGLMFFVIGIVPWWVLGLTVIFLALLLIPPILKIRRQGSNHIVVQESFQKPFEISFALALSVYFVQPWILNLVHWLFP